MITPVLYVENSCYFEGFIWVWVERPENEETANRLLRKAHSMSDVYKDISCVVLLIYRADYPNIVKLSFKRLS